MSFASSSRREWLHSLPQGVVVVWSKPTDEERTVIARFLVRCYAA